MENESLGDLIVNGSSHKTFILQSFLCGSIIIYCKRDRHDHHRQNSSVKIIIALILNSLYSVVFL